VRNSHSVEEAGHDFRVSTRVKELIGDDKGTLLVEDVLKLVEGNWEASAPDVHFVACAEPQHVLSSLGNCFVVEEMCNSDVATDAVATP